MKIISYKQSIAGINIAAQKNIIWPCNAFKIAIPIKKEKILNIFEETILKLTQVETNDTKKLSEMLALDEELVQFVQLRLAELNLLTARYELTSDAKELLDQWDEEEEEYISATVFVDLVSGKILPVVLETYQYEHYIEKKGSSVKFLVGSKGKPRKILSKMIFPNNDHKRKKIVPEDILNTISTFKTLFYRFSSTLDQHISLPQFSRDVGSITILEEPEEIYLHCKVIIPEGSSDFLVTDPFGFDFSSVLSKAIISKENDEWMKKLRMDARDQLMGEGKKSRDTNIDDKLFNLAELEKYETIRQCISDTEYRFSKMKSNPKNQDEKLENIQNTAEFLKQLYEVIESTLKQIEKDNPSAKKWKDIFGSQSSEKNHEVLEGFAKKIGFDLDRYTSILYLQSSSIKSMLNGVVSLEVMIALGLSKAHEDIRHPFYRLAKEVPSLLIILPKLKKYRNSVSHGDELDYIDIFKVDRYKCEKCDIEFLFESEITECLECSSKLIGLRKVDIYRDKIYKCVKSLYPSLKPMKSKNKNNFNSEKTNVLNQAILDAKIGLDKNFSLFELNRLKENTSLYNELLKIETAQKDILHDGSIVITSLSSILQITFDEALKNKQKNLDVDIVRRTALDNALKVGFALTERSFPPELSLVGRKKLKSVMNGNPASLGASFIVFLAVESEINLKYISDDIPNMIAITASLLGYRQHSDKRSQELFKEVGGEKEFTDLKESVYTIIKKIMEA